VDLFLVLVVILILVLIWRGPKTLPELGRMLGRGVRDARAEASKIGSRDEAKSDEGGSTG